jgi:hypothetical protein
LTVQHIGNGGTGNACSFGNINLSRTVHKLPGCVKNW